MKSKKKEIFLKFSLYTTLFGGAFIVLLPLFWMIITACKQSGRALEFKFLPSSVVQGEKKVIDNSKNELASVIFEYDPASKPDITVGEITVAGQFNGWNKERDRMIKDGNVWIAKFSGLKPGPYEYKFVINGNKWIEDPGHPKQSGGNSIIELKPGFNNNKSLSDSTKIDGEKEIGRAHV